MRTKTFRRRNIWSNNTRWRHWWSGVNTGPNYLNRRSHCCECVERWTKYIRNEFVCSTAQLSRIFWFEFVFSIKEITTPNHNKANLRDLIASTGLESCLNLIQIIDFSARVTLKFDRWHRKTIGHLFYTTSSFVPHSQFIGESKLQLQPETLNSGQNRRFFVLCDLEIWWMTLENNRAPLLYDRKLCASFQIHRRIQIGVTVRKRSIWVKIGNFLPGVTLDFFHAPTRTTSSGCFMLRRTVHALWDLYGNPYRNRTEKEEETVTWSGNS